MFSSSSIKWNIFLHIFKHLLFFICNCLFISLVNFSMLWVSFILTFWSLYVIWIVTFCLLYIFNNTNFNFFILSFCPLLSFMASSFNLQSHFVSRKLFQYSPLKKIFLEFYLLSLNYLEFIFAPWPELETWPNNLPNTEPSSWSLNRIQQRETWYTNLYYNFLPFFFKHNALHKLKTCFYCRDNTQRYVHLHRIKVI